MVVPDIGGKWEAGAWWRGVTAKSEGGWAPASARIGTALQGSLTPRRDPPWAVAAPAARPNQIGGGWQAYAAQKGRQRRERDSKKMPKSRWWVADRSTRPVAVGRTERIPPV